MNVYDFDNTLYDGESSVDFFLYYIKKDPALVRYLPKVMNAILRYKAGKITIEDALKDYGKLISEYVRGMDDPEQDVKRFWDKNQYFVKRFYKQLQQEDDLIITASPSLLIREIAKRLGIRHYLSSEIDLETGEITQLCYRENKVKIFKERYPGVKIHNFYTDSMNDKPLMDLSENVYFVRKHRIEKIK